HTIAHRVARQARSTARPAGAALEPVDAALRLTDAPEAGEHTAALLVAHALAARRPRRTSGPPAPLAPRHQRQRRSEREHQQKRQPCRCSAPRLRRPAEDVRDVQYLCSRVHKAARKYPTEPQAQCKTEIIPFRTAISPPTQAPPSRHTREALPRRRQDG